MKHIHYFSKIIIFALSGSIASNGVRRSECQIHIEDVPELGYYAEAGKGLLWVHTTSILAGYYNDDENTNDNFKDIFEDGRMWFNTGDIVEVRELDENDFCLSFHLFLICTNL